MLVGPNSPTGCRTNAGEPKRRRCRCSEAAFELRSGCIGAHAIGLIQGAGSTLSAAGVGKKEPFHTAFTSTGAAVA